MNVEWVSFLEKKKLHCKKKLQMQNLGKILNVEFWNINLFKQVFDLINMEEPYAKLKLYFGLCNSDGSWEGRYSLPKKGEEFSERYIRDFQVVERNLNSKMFGGIQVGRNPLIRSEDDAKKAIEFYSNRIPKISELTELIDCAHGKIRFYRNIKLEGWTKKQEKELIENLKEFNYNPPYYEKERLERELKKDCSEIWKEIVRKDLEKLDFDKPWKDALEFF